MNRSVRNGLAIAGMAGGLFFLGQAVASASGTQVADANGSTTQANTTEEGGGGVNLNGSSANAKNVDVKKVDVDINGGNGGTNNATINTGIVPSNSIEAASLKEGPSGPPREHHEESTTVNLDTGDVALTQNANGGDVNGSGNVAVADSGNQTATATNTVNQSNTSTADDHKAREHEHDGEENHPSTLSPGGPGGPDEHDGNANLNESEANAKNVDITKVDVDINGGNGGTNNADINTGIIGGTFNCPEHTTCTFNITTGDVTVYQNANGGSVNNSGNVGVGAPVPGQCGCPEKSAEAKPGVKAAVSPAKHSSTPLSSAQPSGQLAFTGSDVSLPLTVGLLALVAGIGLTAAGRRRETQTA